MRLLPSALKYAALANADRVAVATGIVSPTVVSMWAWVMPPLTLVATSAIMEHLGTTAIAGALTFNIPATASRLRTIMDFATTDSDAQAATGTVIGGIRQFVAATHDGVNAPKIYWGSLNQPVAEVAYATSVAPTGARIASGTGALYLGNRFALATSWGGLMWTAGFVTGVVFTLKDFQDIAAGHAPRGFIAGDYWTMGKYGTGTVLGERNRLNGTPTGVLPTFDNLPRVGLRMAA